jgi:cytochrome b561
MREATAGAIVQEQMSYDGGARTFHWLTVALLLVIIPMGLIMGALPRGIVQNTFFITHESLGLTVLALTLARFLWRLGHAPPPPSPDLNALERLASSGVHVLIYAVLIIMPVTGYLFVTLSDIDLSYFGIVHVPAVLAPDKPTGKLFGTIHITLQWAIYALALMHIGAALHHYFFRHNDVLARMLPSLRSR